MTSAIVCMNDFIQMITSAGFCFSGRALNIDKSVRLNLSVSPFPFGWLALVTARAFRLKLFQSAVQILKIHVFIVSHKYLTIIPLAFIGYESIAYESEGRMGY